jgi:hypothetical protein
MLSGNVSDGSKSFASDKAGAHPTRAILNPS